MPKNQKQGSSQSAQPQSAQKKSSVNSAAYTGMGQTQTDVEVAGEAGTPLGQSATAANKKPGKAQTQTDEKA